MTTSRYSLGTTIEPFPNVSFVELPGNNHVLIEGTPAFDQFFDEYSRFLAMHHKAG